MIKSLLFLTLLLLSGLAGISYEILYGRMIGNLIGDQFAVSAAVLITFLLGIGIGSRFAWRLWRFLWLIELSIGLCGAAFALGSGQLDALLYSSLPLLPAGLPGSIVAATVLLLLPAFLIGCSLPLFAGYLERLTYGGEFSTVYAIYNVGAAVTVVLIEYLLLRSFGIKGTVFCFVAVNLLIAAALRFGFAAITPPAEQREPSPERDRSWWQLVPVSVASAVFQLLMVKLAEMLLGPFRESFALVLSIVLLGIALGSITVRRFRITLPQSILLAMAGMLVLLVGMEPVAGLYARYYGTLSDSYTLLVLLKWGCLFLLMGLPSMAFGATVPALLAEQALANGSRHLSRESGHLLYVASMANVAGFLLMVFLLHRYLDYGVMIVVIATLAAVSLLLRAWLRIAVPLRGWSLSVLLLVAAVAALFTGWDEELLYISYTNFRDPADLADARSATAPAQRYKGYQDVFAINQVNGSPYFFINGYNSIPLNNPSERIVGALSSYFSPRTQSALVLGLGSGATASVVGQNFDHTDVVEINPVVRENLFRMKQWNFDIESNPRVSIIVDDAIHYTRAATHSYDLILNTVTTPLYFSSSKLYTLDFFGDIKQRLKLDGVYVTWMDARIGDVGADIILNTIARQFRHVALLYIKSSYFLLICSDHPLRSHPLPAFKPGHQIYDNLIREEGIIPEWLPYQLLRSDALALIQDAEGVINSADYPALEFEMARLNSRGLSAFKRRLRQSMDPEQVRSTLGNPTPDYAAEMLWHTRLRLGDASFTRRWQTLLEQAPGFKAHYADVQQRYLQRLIAAEASADALHHAGFVFMRDEQYPLAIRAFKQTLARDPKHDNTHFNLAACFEYSGDYSQALIQYRLEAVVDPDDRDVNYRLGRVQLKMGRFKAAIAMLQASERELGEHARWQLFDALARAYRGAGELSRADAARARAEALRQDRK